MEHRPDAFVTVSRLRFGCGNETDASGTIPPHAGQRLIQWQSQKTVYPIFNSLVRLL